jgi:hypothetical protein
MISYLVVPVGKKSRAETSNVVVQDPNHHFLPPFIHSSPAPNNTSLFAAVAF